MDYSNYTIQELQDSLASIDRRAYPDNYQKLLNELESRREEVTHYELTEQKKRLASIEHRLNLLSLLQAATALAFLYVLFKSLFSEGFSLQAFAIIGIVIALNSSAAWLLYKRDKIGFRLSYINQIAQLFTFTLGVIGFEYSGLGFFLLEFYQVGIRTEAHLPSPYIGFIIGNHLGVNIKLDLAALFFLLLLNTCKEDMQYW